MISFHFHVCQLCSEVWGHDPNELSKEDRTKDHRCPKCGSGPYFVAYETRRDAATVQKFFREGRETEENETAEDPLTVY